MKSTEKLKAWFMLRAHLPTCLIYRINEWSENHGHLETKAIEQMQCVLFRVDATLRKAEVPVIILGKARKKEVEKLSMSSLAMREIDTTVGLVLATQMPAHLTPLLWFFWKDIGGQRLAVSFTAVFHGLCKWLGTLYKSDKFLMILWSQSLNLFWLQTVAW